MIRLTIDGPVLAQVAVAPSWFLLALLALLSGVVIFAGIIVVVVLMARSGKRSSGNPNLIPCPMCAHRVSPEATMCPGCGHPLTPGKT